MMDYRLSLRSSFCRARVARSAARAPTPPATPPPPRRRGSSRSRSASPTMFRQYYTTSVSATPDHIASRGAISMYCRPSRLSIVPQLGTSGGSPKPRKLSDASAMIAHPIVIE